MRQFLRAKIHKATVTEADLAYIGSITIDKDLMDLVKLSPYEKVMVVSNTSGSRLETYVIEGKSGSGTICMNGATAHLIKKGERWLSYDVSIEGISVVNNYRAQFNEIIASSSYEELVKKIKSK